METIKLSKLGNNAVKYKCIKAREAMPEFGGVVGKEYILNKASIMMLAGCTFGDFYQMLEDKPDEARYMGRYDLSRFEEVV